LRFVPEAAMHKIIIDTDPGIDDAMAIHLAFAHPELEVVGLTSIFGKVHVPVATRNALALAEMAGSDCPVAEGTDTPLGQPAHPPGYFVHGDDGFGNSGVIEPARVKDPRSAAQFIVDMVNAHPGEITLCPIGPLTSIALALRLDPTIAEKVTQVVIMGGAVQTPGNVTEYAEANIWHDPHAAAEVFAADWPMTLIGLDVTEVVRCTPEDFNTLEAASPRIGGFLNRAVQFYFEWHKTKPHYAHGPFEGCFMHDPSAVLAITNPDFFTFRETPITVAIEGERIAKTAPATSGPTVRVALQVDHQAVRQAFLDVTSAADIAAAARS
ncbi:MAG: nucleoside hydrolase, partial [Pseudomonadota bacterium]